MCCLFLCHFKLLAKYRPTIQLINCIIQHRSLTKNNIESHNVTFAFEAAPAKFACLHMILMRVSFMLPQNTLGVQRKNSAVVESYSQVQKSLQIPEGDSVPDFEEKLRPITAQEGEVTRSFHLAAPWNLKKRPSHCLINNCEPLRL